ncbi:MAG: Uncharacterized protein OD814_000578 [Candidatus Alkanophagales archaeon MCA70_species_1]|nr:Uncharacterized protein [Candidatus Alkanophaga volatiphilum]
MVRWSSVAAALVMVALVITTFGVAAAHFLMLLPETTEPTAADFFVEEGGSKTFWLIWGHPYEHVLFDCPAPERVWMVDPEGAVEELTATPTTVEGVQAWQVSYTFMKAGDYILCVELKAEEHEVWDYVKTIVHCGGEIWEGWNQNVGQKAEIMPYVRPYGIEEGFVFSGKALYNGEPLVGADVEVEMYHPKDVAEAVVSEAEARFQPNPSCMYTRVVTTDSDGEFSFTLDEPGIWYIAAYGPEEEGMEVRGVLQVAVGEAFPAPAAAAIPTELEKKVTSLESRVSGLEGALKAASPTLVYAAIVLSVIAIILSVVALALRRK